MGGVTRGSALLPPLTTDSAPLGRCPVCGRRLPATARLIEYERDDGSVGVYADCPSCGDVVEPRRD